MKAYKEKTGYDNPSQNPEILEKIRETRARHYGDGDLDKANKELYRRRSMSYKEKTGYGNAGQNPEVKAKVRKTVQERYGVDNVFQDEEVKRKIVDTNMERYGVPYAHLQPERGEAQARDDGQVRSPLLCPPARGPKEVWGRQPSEPQLPEGP